MPDVFTRLGKDLRAVHPTSSVSRPRAGRRLILILAGTLAVAAPAVAITQPWEPPLERPGIDQPVASSAEPVSGSARETLAVLRRPQTPEDRQRTAPLLSAIGAGNQVNGVQTDGIRAIAEGWALVPALEIKSGDRVLRDQLCFTDGRSVTCGSSAKVANAGITGSEATNEGTTFTGLVPDGVAAVRFISQAGSGTNAPVRSNFFELHVRNTAPKGTVRGPDGSMIPAPPLPVQGTFEWLDPDGKVVGPRSR